MDGQGGSGKEYRFEIFGLVIPELVVGFGAIGETTDC
jgi:hypothetical protein